MQYCSNSWAIEMDLLQSCTRASTWYWQYLLSTIWAMCHRGISTNWTEIILLTLTMLNWLGETTCSIISQYWDGPPSWSTSAWKTTSSPFYQHGLTLIPAWMNNYIHYKMWDEITYPFLNFNGCTVEVQEWLSNFIPHFTGLVITYPRWD